MKSSISSSTLWAQNSIGAVKSIAVGIVFVLGAQVLSGKPGPHEPQGIVSDWTHHHVLFPDTEDDSVKSQIRRDPRWMSNWYHRHHEAWWRDHHRWPGEQDEESIRDWSVPLGAASFEPVFDGNYTFVINAQTGFGNLNAISEGGGNFLAT